MGIETERQSIRKCSGPGFARRENLQCSDKLKPTTYTAVGIAQLPVIHFEYVSAHLELIVVIPLTAYVVGFSFYGELRI